MKIQFPLQGAFQSKAHEMNEKRFPKSQCASQDRSFNESWYHCRSYKEKTFPTIGYRDWRKANVIL